VCTNSSSHCFGSPLQITKFLFHFFYNFHYPPIPFTLSYSSTLLLLFLGGPSPSAAPSYPVSSIPLLIFVLILLTFRPLILLFHLPLISLLLPVDFMWCEVNCFTMNDDDKAEWHHNARGSIHDWLLPTKHSETKKTE
jgi:hypothetical protein